VAGSNNRKGRKIEAQNSLSSPRRTQFSSPKTNSRNTPTGSSRTGLSSRNPSSSHPESTKKDKTTSRSLPPGEKQKISAGTINSFSVLDGDENENESDTISRSSPDSSRLSEKENEETEVSTPTSERRKLKLKKPTVPSSTSWGSITNTPTTTKDNDTRVFFPPEENKRPSNQNKEKNQVFDREKTEKHLKGILEEFLTSEDLQEACLCVTELSEKLPKDNSEIGLHLLITQALEVGVEKKDKDRLLLNKLFTQMHEEKILSKDDFAAGFNETLQSAEDLLIDFPKFFDFLALVLANLIDLDALNLSYLDTEATEPLQPKNKEKLINLVKKAIKSDT